MCEVADYLIVHNEVMAEYIAKHFDIPKDRLIPFWDCLII